MSLDVCVNPDFRHIKEGIVNIYQNYDVKGHVIFKGRNELRVVEIDGIRLVIKYFKRITWANRIIYRFFRKSKACRSYQNAFELLRRGVATPQPVAYIDEYKGCVLKRSFFLSEYVEHENLDFSASILEDRKLVIELAGFIHFLHQRGIFHRDLNIGNILYKQVENKYDFHLIDNNRLRFDRPTEKKMIENLKRLFMPFETYASFVYAYAEVAEINAYSLMEKLLWVRKKKVTAWRIKTSLKKAFLTP